MRTNHNELKRSFGPQAELYDRIRPQYPQEVFDYLFSVIKDPETKKIFEIGAGTGQGTESLLRSGASTFATDISTEMIELLNKKFNGYRNLRSKAIAFEDFDSDERFDLITSFQAIHWIDPKMRYIKSAELLKPGAHIAWIRNNPGNDNSSPFWRDFDALYEKHFETFNVVKQGPAPRDRSKLIFDEINESNIFKASEIRSFFHTVKYKTEEFVSLMQSQSNHILAKDKLETLYSEMRELIDSYGGVIDFRYETLVALAKKL